MTKKPAFKSTLLEQLCIPVIPVEETEEPEFSPLFLFHPCVDPEKRSRLGFEIRNLSDQLGKIRRNYDKIAFWLVLRTLPSPDLMSGGAMEFMQWEIPKSIDPFIPQFSMRKGAIIFGSKNSFFFRNYLTVCISFLTIEQDDDQLRD